MKRYTLQQLRFLYCFTKHLIAAEAYSGLLSKTCHLSSNELSLFVLRCQINKVLESLVGWFGGSFLLEGILHYGEGEGKKLMYPEKTPPLQTGVTYRECRKRQSEPRALINKLF